MLVQNQKDLRVANRMYGRKLPTFGWAGHNDEYAQYWRKLIKAKWPKRNSKQYLMKLHLMGGNVIVKMLNEWNVKTHLRC